MFEKLTNSVVKIWSVVSSNRLANIVTIASAGFFIRSAFDEADREKLQDVNNRLAEKNDQLRKCLRERNERLFASQDDHNNSWCFWRSFRYSERYHNSISQPSSAENLAADIVETVKNS